MAWPASARAAGRRPRLHYIMPNPFKREGKNPAIVHADFARESRTKLLDYKKEWKEKQKVEAAAGQSSSGIRAACVGVAGDIRSEGAALRTATAFAWRVRVQKLFIFLPLFPSCMMIIRCKKSCLRTSCLCENNNIASFVFQYKSK